MASENAQSVALVDRCRRFEANSSQFFDTFDSLIVLTINFAQMLTSRDLVIFMSTTMTDGQTNYFTPCACAQSNYHHTGNFYDTGGYIIRLATG